MATTNRLGNAFQIPMRSQITPEGEPSSKLLRIAH